MNFSKKTLLSGAIILTTLAPTTLLFTSCSSTEEPFEIGISPELEKYYGDKLIEKIQSDPKIAQRTTLLVVSAGPVNDKSFNQSVWGALQTYKKQAQMSGSTVTYLETLDNAGLSSVYDKALEDKYQTWVLTGFQQEGLFKQWLAKGTNRDKFVASKAIIVGVDWDNFEDADGVTPIVPAGQFFGLQFKTNEAAWVVGQAASAYLTSTNKKPHLSSFGGGIFEGITDFNNGFLQGMLDWNANNPTQKVKFYSGNEEANTIDLGTGFNPLAPGIQDTISKLIGTNENAPQIILPVAGSLVATTIDNIKDKNTQQMIIGVDTNQAATFPQDKTRFFSSIEKRVAVAVYKTLMLLSGVKLDYTDANSGIVDKGFEGKFVAGVTSETVKYGFDKGFVGYSPSTLAGKDATTVNKFLAEAFARFNQGMTKSNPTIIFQPMKDASKNQSIIDRIIMEVNQA